MAPKTKKSTQKPSYIARKEWMNTTLEGCSFRMYDNAKSRAKRQGIVFTLELSDITIPPLCPLLGIPLVIGGGNSGKYNSPSLDRINPSGGYTPDNVWVISWRANKLKSDATLDEFICMTHNWTMTNYRRNTSERTKRVQGADEPRHSVDPGKVPLVRGRRTDGN